MYAYVFMVYYKCYEHFLFICAFAICISNSPHNIIRCLSPSSFLHFVSSSAIKLESPTCHISPSPFLFSIFLVCFITCHVLYKPSHSVSQKLRKANEQGDDLLKNSFHINLLEEIFQFPHSSCSCILLSSFFLYLSPPLCVS